MLTPNTSINMKKLCKDCKKEFETNGEINLCPWCLIKWLMNGKKND